MNCSCQIRAISIQMILLVFTDWMRDRYVWYHLIRCIWYGWIMRWDCYTIDMRNGEYTLLFSLNFYLFYYRRIKDLCYRMKLLFLPTMNVNTTTTDWLLMSLTNDLPNSRRVLLSYHKNFFTLDSVLTYVPHYNLSYKRSETRSVIHRILKVPVTSHIISCIIGLWFILSVIISLSLHSYWFVSYISRSIGLYSWFPCQLPWFEWDITYIYPSGRHSWWNLNIFLTLPQQPSKIHVLHHSVLATLFHVETLNNLVKWIRILWFRPLFSNLILTEIECLLTTFTTYRPNWL